MDVSSWINLGIFLLTGIALWMAILQARESRRLRDETRGDQLRAAASAAEAAASVTVIAAASSRTAGATEQIAGSGDRSASALVQIATPATPWTLTRIHPRGHQWMLRNEGNRTLHTIRIATIDPDEQHYLVPESVDLLSPEVWSPEESEILTFDGGSIADPAQLRFAIEYTIDGDETVHRWKGLLT